VVSRKSGVMVGNAAGIAGTEEVLRSLAYFKLFCTLYDNAFTNISKFLRQTYEEML
jgi:hypothetical protein